MLEVAPKAAPDLTSFYGAFAPLCFTLLGLWLIVVQTRHAEWRSSPHHRNRAYILSTHFALPGLMSLLALIDPGNQGLWRVAFAAVAIGGVALVGASVIAPVGRGNSRVALAANSVAIVIYGLVALVALAPATVHGVGIHLYPLAIEELLLAALVFLAVNVAWFLMFDEVPGAGAGAQPK